MMKQIQKNVAVLLLASLLGAVGVSPLCASCAPAAMDCCKAIPRQAPSLDKTSCCAPHFTAPPEQFPARLSPESTSPNPDTPIDVAYEEAAFGSPAVISLSGPASQHASNESSRPLFLLNASLLR
jgi:hypothetical protein